MKAVRLDGKIAIVTGASQGLGFAIADAFVRAGASVAICARSTEHLEDTTDKLRALAGYGQKVESIAADVSRPEGAESVAALAHALGGRIDILVNNAGVYGPMGAIEEIDWEAWVRALEINVLGSVLMAREAVRVMKRQGSGKIVQLSGGGATNPMPLITAYAASKAAIVRFAESLAEEVREFGIDVNSIAPGALNTRMLDEILAAGPERVGASFYERAMRQKENGGAGLVPGTELALFLASEASNGITGKLISAVWDAWPDWPAHVEELRNSDLFTIRRIVGADRGVTWGGR